MMGIKTTDCMLCDVMLYVVQDCQYDVLHRDGISTRLINYTWFIHFKKS